MGCIIQKGSKFGSWWGIALLLLAVAACDSGISSGALPDPAGEYLIGRDYADTLQVRPRGAGYSLAWRRGGSTTYGGVALYAGNVLGGVFWPGDEPGDPDLRVMAYQIEDGRLSGTWISVGAKATIPGREDLSGAERFEGRHEITLGQRPDQRGPYTGVVEISGAGPIYAARWSLNGAIFLGTGIRIGDTLVVGYSDKGPPGVIAYCMTESGGLGLWTSGRSVRLAVENISRNGASVGGSAEDECG